MIVYLKCSLFKNVSIKWQAERFIQKNTFSLSLLKSQLFTECLLLYFSFTRQDSFALIMKIPGAGRDSVSEVQCKHSRWFSPGKIKFLKWLLLKSFFFFFFLRAHNRKDLQVQEEHSSIILLLLKEELCFLPSQYSIPVACGIQARWKGGVPPHSDPNQTSAWQRPMPFHWDKTQTRSVQ